MSETLLNVGGYGGSSGTLGGYDDNGVNDGYYRPGVSQVPIQVNRPDYGSHGGSQSNANANANANANGGNGGAFPGSSYYPAPSGSTVIGNANSNAHANAAANAAGGGGVNVAPGNYPGRGIDQIEVIPINTLPISQPTSPVYPVHPVHPTSHQPPREISQGKGNAVIPIVIVEDSPGVRYPPYQRPPPHYHHHHRRPHYGGKPKQQPVEIIIIEESAPSQGDTS